MEPQTIVLALAALDFADDGEQTLVAKRAQRDLEVVSQRIAKAKSALGREYVSTISKGDYPAPDFLRTARWLDDLTGFVLLAKADGQGARTEEYEQWAGRRVKRVGGRFARATGTAGPQSLNRRKSDRIRERVGAKLPGGLEYTAQGINWQGGVPPSGTTRQQAEQWMGAQLLADEMQGELKRAFGADADLIDLKLNVQDPDDPSKISVMDPDKYDPTMGQAISMGLDVDQNALASASPEVRRRVARQLAIMQGGEPGQTAQEVLSETSPFTQGMSTLGKPGALRNDKRSVFSGVAQSAGQLLQGFGPTAGIGATLESIGAAAGSPGAQAIEPYVQRAAARYTGTRTKPSEEIQEAFGDYSPTAAKLEQIRSVTNAARLKRDLDQRRLAAGKTADRSDPNDVVGMDAVDAAAVVRYNAGERKDQLVLGVQSDLAALALGQQLPDDPMLNTLSQKAGKTLPSRGVIIGADGEVAYEAVGQADDHYVPFDARMLGALEGGQFVRTRQKGGPSVEDVRTMLATGSRMATVVSPSGVFELELAPEARGMKRFGPQMQSMTDAYKRLLDTIASNALSSDDRLRYLGSLDPKTSQQIEAKVASIADPERARDERNRLTQKAYVDAASKNAGVDREQLYQEQLKVAAGMNDAERGELTVQEYARRAADAELRMRVRPLMLNGEGYDLALRTLQARFPHMIRSARYRDTQQFARDVGKPSAAQAGLPRSAGKDAGYLQPGQVKTFGGTDQRQSAEQKEAAEQAKVTQTSTTPPGEKTQSSAKDKASGRETTRTTETVDPESGAVKASAAAAQEAKNALRQAKSGFASQLASNLGAKKEGWQAVLGLPPTADGQPGVFPDSFDEALEHRKMNSTESTAVLYATALVSGGKMDALLDEMGSNPALRDALLAVPQEEAAEAIAVELEDLTMADGPKADAAQVTEEAARIVKQVAMLDTVANPTFVEVPADEKALATLARGQLPLPAELANVTTAADYATWANSDDDLASMPGKSRVGRRLLTSGLESESGLDLMEGLQANLSDLDNDLDTLAKDLKGKDGENEAQSVVSRWSSPETRAMIPPEIKTKLESIYGDERTEAIDYLKGAIRLGLSTHQLQMALEVGDADPKVLAERWPTLRIATGRYGAQQGLLEFEKSMTRQRPSPSRPITWRALRQQVLSSA